MTLVFGLTGGIATGKSTVAAYLSEAGIPIVDADVASKEVVKKGTILIFKEGVLEAKCLEVKDEGLRMLEFVYKGLFLEILNELAQIFEVDSIEDSISKFESIYHSLNLVGPSLENEDELDELVDSVNLQRLSNNPVSLDKEIIREKYIKILNSNLQ